MHKFIERIQTKEMLFGSGALFLFLGSLLLVIMIVVGIVMLARSGDQYSANVITVSGTGEVSAAPDTAVFSFTIRNESETVGEAQTAVNTQAENVLEALRMVGISEKDLSTQSYVSNPRYEYRSATTICRLDFCPPSGGERVLTGYEVSQSIEVKVRDMALTGAVAETLGAAGITEFYGPQFTIDDPDELQTQAKELAIEDARKEAKRLSRELGVRLGKLVNYSEGGGYYPMYESRAMMAGASMDMAESAPKAQLPTGEQDVTASVTLTYKIK